MDSIDEDSINEHSTFPGTSKWVAGESPVKAAKENLGGGNELILSATSEKRAAKKTCRVCGDKAFSYNFNVITCESCKAFFRRNANKEKEIRCPFNNSCDITTLSRRFCQRCRLQKCFDVGMKKEWIMSEKARLEKRQRIIENRERKTTELTLGDDQPNPTSRSETPPVCSIERPVPIAPDSISLSSEGDATAFTPFKESESETISTTAVMTVSSTSFELPTLKTPEAFSPLFGESSFRPFSDPITTNSLMTAPLQGSNPFLIGLAQDCGIATQHVQLNAQIQRAAQIEQYLQQQAATQTVLQSFPSSFYQNVSALTNEMVTLPKHALLTLLEQIRFQSPVSLPPGHEAMGVPPKCQCFCTCGRYPANSLVIDEVMKEILANPVSVPRSTSSSPKTQFEVKPLTEPKKENDVFLSPFNLSNTAYSLKSNQSTSQAKRGCSLTFQGMNTRSMRKRNRASLLEEEMDSVIVDPDCCLMTSSDQDRLSEVISANAVWTEMKPNDSGRDRHEDGCSTFFELISLADVAIRKMVKMTKRLNTFQKIEHHDQIHLLKGSCLDYIILRSALSYVPNKRCWKIPDCSCSCMIPIDALQDAPENMLGHFLRFYSLFKNEIRTNKCVMLLVGMLVVFNPDHKSLKNKAAVEEEQSHYKRVLKRLLFSLCGQDQIKTNEELTVLLANIYELRLLSQRAQKLIKEMDSGKLEPLLLEMFCK